MMKLSSNVSYTNMTFLRGVPQRLRENSIRAGLRKSLNVFLDEAKATVPVDTGALKKSLSKKVSATRNGAFGYVGPKKDKTYTVYYYGERGKRGAIYTVRKKRNKQVLRKRVKAPWKYIGKIEESTNFLRKAVSSKKPEFLKRLRADVKAALDVRSKKLAGA